ncbi:hypothetical protein D9619_010924 [Psilocybe cf. subviscida]|uniref:Potassium channel domain-containing protein n=1 Tax=Psilocybe cf. subviscida TaxID=2480587 RepID=A0A8H5B896_9AGAR|nr:hypothetical protein D9619_010924 [Psilocybe cf. subviscida]
MLVFNDIVHHLRPSHPQAGDVEKQVPGHRHHRMHLHTPHLHAPHLHAPHLHAPHFHHTRGLGPDVFKGDPTRTYRILPIFSGIMIPFSIMLSIPSLTGHWYIRTGEKNQLVEVQDNPLLLDVAMGFSMACGVLANTCLVVRFSERRIKLMTMLCIMFLTLHDLINIPAVTAFGVLHRFDDGFTYGQSFWLTVCSTIFSTATNFTLIYDYIYTEDFGTSGSGLTTKQRSLVIITIVLLCYVSLGSLVLAIMMETTFIDALYLSVVSIETIGFGDINPRTIATRIVVCAYIAGGILNLALAVALAREALLEAAAASFQARLHAARNRQRERHIRSRWRAAVRWRLRAHEKPMWVDDREEERKARVGLSRRHHWYSAVRHVWRRVCGEVWREWEDPAWKYVYGPKHQRLNLEVLSQAQLEAAAFEAGAPLSALVPKGLKLYRWDDESDPAGASNDHPSLEAGGNRHPLSLTHIRMGGMVSFLGRFAVAVTHGPSADEEPNIGQDFDHPAFDENQRNRRKSGVPLTRSLTMTTITMYDDDAGPPESLEMVERNAFRARLAVALGLFIVFWTAGSAIFMKTEGWTFGSSVYFCFVSFTTVGYGDLAPRTPAGRSIFVVWALLGVGTMTILISILAEAYSSGYKSVIRTEVYKATSDIFQPGNETTMKRASSAESPNACDPSALSPATASSATASAMNVHSTKQDRPTLSRRTSFLSPPAEERNFMDDITPNHDNADRDEMGARLPHDVIREAESLMDLLATRLHGEAMEGATNGPSPLGRNSVAFDLARNADPLLLQVEKSLQRLTSYAKESLDARMERKKYE